MKSFIHWVSNLFGGAGTTWGMALMVAATFAAPP
jgi:hypothetical protein